MRKSSAPTNAMSENVDETSMGFNVLFEDCMPTKTRGKTTGRLNTGARNPAWLAFDAMAPMRVKMLPTPPITSVKFIKYAHGC